MCDRNLLRFELVIIMTFISAVVAGGNHGRGTHSLGRSRGAVSDNIGNSPARPRCPLP